MQPAILISFVWVGMNVSCFEMLERFQTKLGKNKISWVFFFIIKFTDSNIL